MTTGAILVEENVGKKERHATITVLATLSAARAMGIIVQKQIRTLYAGMAVISKVCIRMPLLLYLKAKVVPLDQRHETQCIPNKEGKTR